MKNPRKYIDVFIGLGASFVLLSIIIAVLFLAFPLPEGNSYIGGLLVIFLALFFVGGLVLFVTGVFIEVVRRKGRGGPKELPRPKWATVDLKDERQRRRFLLFIIGGVIEILIVLIVGYRIVEYTDTPYFCGQTCHKVMYPEFTAYQPGYHARVPCAQCHIGPGASFFVKAKISGIRQVFATVFNTYPRPIETPVENLRPARDTCEECHWPQKFSGDIFRTFPHYASDEKNTVNNVLWAMRVGSGESDVAGGIHWHVAAKVWYLPLDDARQNIGWVGVEQPDGTLKEYVAPGAATEITPDRIADEKRLMDCIDCHNRATHNFRSPEQLVDQYLYQGKLDTNLPFLRKKALEALDAPSVQAADANLEQLRVYYRTTYPDVYTAKRQRVDQAIGNLQGIARLTIFPDMNVNSKTHSNNLGHQQSPGCFRCHGKLAEQSGADKGQSIVFACDTCHYTPATLK